MPTNRWLAAVESERDNYREALRRSLGDADAASEMVACGVTIAADLGRFWWERGALREGLEWLAAALERTPSVSPDLRARCKLQLGFMLNLYGRHVEAEAVLREAAQQFRFVGDDEALMVADNASGLAKMWNGDYIAAREHFGRVLEYRTRTGSERGAAVALHNLGQLHGLCFLETERGREYLQRSLPAFRSVGDLRCLTRTFEIAAQLSRQIGDLGRALREVNEAVMFARAIDNQLCLGEALEVHARILFDLGDEAAGLACLRAIHHYLTAYLSTGTCGTIPRDVRASHRGLARCRIPRSG